MLVTGRYVVRKATKDLSWSSPPLGSPGQFVYLVHTPDDWELGTHKGKARLGTTKWSASPAPLPG